MKIVVVAITRHGIALAGRIVAGLAGAQLHAPARYATEAQAAAPGAHCFAGKLGDGMAVLFAQFDALVCVVSLGAVVRLIAPHLERKETDPAVLVVDEAGHFVIPVLSGHAGGANALAGQLAPLLGATAVLTSASDARALLAIDLLGRELGWRIEADHDTLVRASAAMVNDEPVALVQEAGARDWWTRHANGRSGPLPANLKLFHRIEDIVAEEFSAVLWVATRALPSDIAARLAGRCVVYRP